MAIILKLESDNREFIIAPAGNHLARLFSIVDLGTQIIEWEGKEKEQRKLTLSRKVKIIVDIGIKIAL